MEGERGGREEGMGRRDRQGDGGGRKGGGRKRDGRGGGKEGETGKERGRDDMGLIMYPLLDQAGIINGC